MREDVEGIPGPRSDSGVALEGATLPTLTANARAFVAANKRSSVTAGFAFGNGGEGGSYTLKNGKTFDLTADECRQVGIRWAVR